jgi:hypothetical protein
MREQLPNCALDQRLARSIFDAISSGKPQDSLALEKLTVEITDDGQFATADFPTQLMDVLLHRGRSWQITRNIRDDRRHEILVEQTQPFRADLLHYQKD